MAADKKVHRLVEAQRAGLRRLGRSALAGDGRHRVERPGLGGGRRRTAGGAGVDKHARRGCIGQRQRGDTDHLARPITGIAALAGFGRPDSDQFQRYARPAVGQFHQRRQALGQRCTAGQADDDHRKRLARRHTRIRGGKQPAGGRRGQGQGERTGEQDAPQHCMHPPSMDHLEASRKNSRYRSGCSWCRTLKFLSAARPRRGDKGISAKRRRAPRSHRPPPAR